MGLAAFNRMRRNQAEKAQQVEPEAEQGKPIDKMTKAELIEYAEANEIEFPEDVTKVDDMKAFLAQQVEPEAE